MRSQRQQPVADIDSPVAAHGMPPPMVEGYGPGVGMTGAALTPALPISIEPSGIPARAAPPGGVTIDGEGLLLVLVLLPHAPVVTVLPGSGALVPVPMPPPS